MTRDEAKKLLPVIQAFAEGKDVQFRYDGWEDIDDPSFDPDFEYRIKPEPVECWITRSKAKIDVLHETLEEAEEWTEKGVNGPYTIHHMREVI